MLEVVQSATFSQWLSKLGDRQAKARILTRIRRLEMGNPGDVKPAGGGISELRIDFGPGYRVYLVQRDSAVVLLCAGDKRTQQADIRRAAEIAKDWPIVPAARRTPQPGHLSKGRKREKGRQRPRK